MSKYRLFDRSQIRLCPLSVRGHDVLARDCIDLHAQAGLGDLPEIQAVADTITEARRNGRAVVLMMGAHPIKLGLSRYLVDLVSRRLVTHIAMNGAGVIHDYELAAHGGTSEDVAKWIRRGQFGLWDETSALNELIAEGARRNEGLGEVIGRTIEEQEMPARDVSICAAGYRANTPVTSHVTVGADIIHAMPNCNGAHLGKTSYTDFLIFAESLRCLDGGVYLNVGTAVTGPEVFLKALSMVRNASKPGSGKVMKTSPQSFTTAVFDLVNLPPSWRDGSPKKDDPLYYYRPWKTILCRTVSDGGSSYYIHGDHRQTIPTLWQTLTQNEEESARFECVTEQ